MYRYLFESYLKGFHGLEERKEIEVVSSTLSAAKDKASYKRTLQNFKDSKNLITLKLLKKTAV